MTAVTAIPPSRRPPTANRQPPTPKGFPTRPRRDPRRHRNGTSGIGGRGEPPESRGLTAQRPANTLAEATVPSPRWRPCRLPHGSGRAQIANRRNMAAAWANQRGPDGIGDLGGIQDDGHGVARRSPGRPGFRGFPNCGASASVEGSRVGRSMPGNGSPAWTQGAPGAGPRQPAAMSPRHHPPNSDGPKNHCGRSRAPYPGMAAG